MIKIDLSNIDPLPIRIQAEFQSKCGACGDSINEGDWIIKEEGGDWIHEECVEP